MMLTDAMKCSPFAWHLLGDETSKMAMFNLICSKRDLQLWTSHKIKPTANWKVTDVKKYFGIKGSGQALMDEFMVLHDTVWDAIKEKENEVE